MSSKTPSVSSASSPRAVKKENQEEEIKEFAETAMNELLGWYGYEHLELRRWAASRNSPDSSHASDTKDKDECSWCNNAITGENVLHQSGAKFCSEICFSQSRRATFKRAKTCDWCRHVRHTVAYVDFQDGATQLQFCSDKCLNQYKMHIFCKETQAHLDLNPHLINTAASSTNTNLITPDLWLKNCKSRSTSPTSARTPSPSAENLKKAPALEKETNRTKLKSPLPMITIAPSSKLLKSKSPEENLQPKQAQAKKEFKHSKASFRKRRTSKCSSTVTSQSFSRQTNTPKIQDLRMSSPQSTLERSSPASTLGNSAIHSPPNHHNIPIPNIHPSMPNFGMEPPMFIDPMMATQNDPRFSHMHHNGIFHRPIRPGVPFQHERLHMPGVFPNLGIGQPPPITIMVPYPVVLPLPIPIPVPLPLTAFLQAYERRNHMERVQQEQETPLDFTMNSEKTNERKTPETNKIDEDLNDSGVKEKKNTIYMTTAVTLDRITDQEEHLDDCNESVNPEEIPKFKITRIGNKMAKIVSKSKDTSESSRPLRKRKRLVEMSNEEENALIGKTRKIVEV